MTDSNLLAPRSLSFTGAHNELIGLKDRVVGITGRVSAFADHLSGPEVAGAVIMANKPQPTGMINLIFSGIDDLVAALDELEHQIGRVHDL